MPAIERVTMTDKPNETIIEFSADGRIERAQVEDAMRQLDEAMDRGDTVHVFAEIRNFSGMSWEAWRSDLGNAIRYLTRLRQFGRLAVVSDQSWVRSVTRIESALLPFVRYEVYTREQRDHALAWVRGEIATPHPAGLRIVEDGDADILTFKIDGRITSADALSLAEQASALIDRGSGYRLLAIVRNYDGFEPALLVDTKLLELKLRLLRHIGRYALVGGPDWLARLTDSVDPLIKMQVRHFPAGEEDAARAWLRSDAA
jgi:hypothetical protein